ncbi:MAG: stage II sporulation protein M [Defluviitaleaceae bacterium]|nr:stage II sporulation protein M [Defluviitaleaceae bacterium]MCL2264351.1 stage II sporulation protein M [Defluviitaleaceae bacterium]
MTENVFVSRNEEQWKALEAFNSRLRKRGGIKKADTEEVREFARLFRLVGFHLAYAKTHYPDGNTLPYLNNLVGVSHNFFYVRERGSWFSIREYFAYTLPKTIRETYKYWGAAMAVFFFGALFAAFYVAGDTARVSAFVPDELLAGWLRPDDTPGLNVEGYRDSAFMTAFYITNNTTVAFNAFVWGILAGVGSLFVLFYNGLMIGGFFGFMHGEGANMLVLYSQILPHGILELSAIFLAGGGGLMLGKGFLMPGEHTRAHSLILHGKTAAKLIPAIVIMMAIAALIEGYFSFNDLGVSPVFKLAFAGLTGVGMVAYFLKGILK